MEVRLFGELEALDGGVPVPVRGAKQRALLAQQALQLAGEPGRPVLRGTADMHNARLVPVTVDGLIYASSMVLLDSARRKVPVASVRAIDTRGQLCSGLLSLRRARRSNRRSPGVPPHGRAQRLGTRLNRGAFPATGRGSPTPLVNAALHS